MGIEIERKFLVDDWPQTADSKVSIYQAYLTDGPTSVRIRVSTQGDRRDAFLTVKGKATGMTRAEFEYPIPYTDAAAMLTLAVGAPIEKERFIVRVGHHVWEVDVFLGANAPLIVAEIELTDESEAFEIPDWLGVEVTDDKRYLNAYLAKDPFNTW